MLELDPQRNALEGRARVGLWPADCRPAENWNLGPGARLQTPWSTHSCLATLPQQLLPGHHLFLREDATQFVRQRAGVFSVNSFVQRARVFSGYSFVQRAEVFSGCSFVQRAGVFSGCSYRRQGCSLAVPPLEPRYRVTRRREPKR